MRYLIYIAFLGMVHHSAFAQEATINKTFTSSKKLNQFAFSNSELSTITKGHLIDFEDEWTAVAIDSFFYSMNLNNSGDVDGLLSMFNLLERTDVQFQFEKDSLLFPIMNHLYSINGKDPVNIPLFIMDVDFSHLKTSKRSLIENWLSDTPYPAFGIEDIENKRIFYTSFFIDTLRNNHTHLYWNTETVLSNTGRSISTVQIIIGNDTLELGENQFFNISSRYARETIQSIEVLVTFSDLSLHSSQCKVLIEPSNLRTIKSWPNLDDMFWNWEDEIGTNPTLTYDVKYGCGNDGKLNKPFIMVAGWGPFTDKNFINNRQVWPSGPNELYTTWNQEGFIDNLLDAGYDIVIARFTPPNADIRLNADRLETLINLINEEKFSNGSYEENIVLGYSAGALCAKLALQRIEKKHLDHGGNHPHTKLFISFDGENQGANIPLAIQHAVNYLDEYQNGPLQFKVYALHYLLNAPLTKQLLKYFHSESGTTAQPAQGHHWLRDHYLYEHAYANHSKNTHLPGYPSFTRNVSVSNGSNESNINGVISNHYPYPSIEKYPLYTQINNRREWHATFSGTMGQQVFSYRKKPLFGSWSVEMEAVTAPDCLVLDNAPGGMIFIEQNSNPLVSVLKLMKSKINVGQPQVYNLHTLFSFTPTLFTHDIRNFNAANTNYRMDYSMKVNKLLYQNIDDADAEILNNQSDYWGYPHLAYPNTHYWEVTPFDAVFSWSVNTEHITFSEAIKDSPTSPTDVWRDKYSSSKGIVKNFLLDETDFHNAFIQNKQYGWYARDNYVYRAEVNAGHEIYAGENVTQRTDFNSAEVLSNANITFRAGQAIYLKPGTHIHAGATFHAVIESNACVLNDRPVNGAPNPEPKNSTYVSEKSAKNQIELESEKITIYPNPSNGEFCIQATGDINTESPLEYWVFDTSGKKVAQGIQETNSISLPLNKGLYILKLKKDEKISTHKVGIL